ncbi:hypothetical protein HEB94_006755 [Actinopolymorpha pittospori]|uniref:Uncharacterized protein n=1 Tax=Actinopolymorpha pittospori TaxID=648752 RepID=A0A927N186_9ACTN|nr:hypothetical protein [Actinopolymorpha pittospori]
MAVILAGGAELAGVSVRTVSNAINARPATSARGSRLRSHRSATRANLYARQPSSTARPSPRVRVASTARMVHRCHEVRRRTSDQSLDPSIAGRRGGPLVAIHRPDRNRCGVPARRSAAWSRRCPWMARCRDSGSGIGGKSSAQAEGAAGEVQHDSDVSPAGVPRRLPGVPTRPPRPGSSTPMSSASSRSGRRTCSARQAARAPGRLNVDAEQGPVRSCLRAGGSGRSHHPHPRPVVHEEAPRPPPTEAPWSCCCRSQALTLSTLERARSGGRGNMFLPAPSYGEGR